MQVSDASSEASENAALGQVDSSNWSENPSTRLVGSSSSNIFCRCCLMFRQISWFGDVREDLARRAPHYASDWTDGLHSKVVSSSLFMLFTSIAPAITFAAVLDSATQVDGMSMLGVVEVILSMALTGCIFSVFGGQPLCIVGVTGPVTIFTISCFTVAREFGLPFLPFYCWVQLWSGVMHMVLAATGACAAVKLVTRFSCETFGMLIAVIYIFTGVTNLCSYFTHRESAAALLSVLLGLGTTLLALTLSGARAWSLFSRRTRVTIADYGAFSAVVIFCAAPYAGYLLHLTPTGCVGCLANETIATLEVPSSFGPTFTGRSWLVPLFDLSFVGVLVALPFGFFLTVLFFFDHNVSSILCQVPDFGLKKGSAYHWDFFVIGVMIVITGLLGVPPVNGLIPQAPLHTDSLCEKKWVTDSTGSREVIVKCYEQRVSNLAQAVLTGLTLLVLPLLGLLPIAALDGLFLYMGIASFGGSTFFSRIVLFCTDKERRTARRLPYLATVPMQTINCFTMTQLAILAAIFAVTRLPLVDGLFPVLIAVLVPLRIYIMPRIFTAAHVDAIDFKGAVPDQPPDQLTHPREGSMGCREGHSADEVDSGAFERCHIPASQTLAGDQPPQPPVVRFAT